MSDQTVAGMVAAPRSGVVPLITPSERQVLRRLATQVAELAARPVEQEKRELWYRHNALQPTRPVIFCDPENGWNEIITPDQMACEGELARAWEMRLRKEIYWGAEMQDDRVVQSTFEVAHVYSESDWGMHETVIGGEDGGSYVWDAPLQSYDLLGQLRFPQIAVDHEATGRMLSLAQETLGDLLSVRLKTVWWWSTGMTWTLIKLRGLSQMMYDMLDHPDELHRLMAFLRDGNQARLDWLESHDLLSLNNDGTYVGSGGFGWSHELPGPGFRRSRAHARHVGVCREPGDGGRVTADVRRVHFPVSASAAGTLRAELLRLLRAARQAVARRQGHPQPAPRLDLALEQRRGHGRAPARSLHPLAQATPRGPGHAGL